MTKNWRTLRVLVGVRVPEGTYTEKDLAWAIDRVAGEIDRNLRRFRTEPTGLIRAKHHVQG